jgi:hypothetical protein
VISSQEPQDSSPAAALEGSRLNYLPGNHFFSGETFHLKKKMFFLKKEGRPNEITVRLSPQKTQA